MNITAYWKRKLFLPLIINTQQKKNVQKNKHKNLLDLIFVVHKVHILPVTGASMSIIVFSDFSSEAPS